MENQDENPVAVKIDKKIIDEVKIFTDGSFSKPNGGKLCGYGIYFPNKDLPNVSKPFTREPMTNQRAELFAIYVALVKIIKNIKFKKIMIYSDSEYSIKSLTKWAYDWEKKGWKTSTGKTVENMDIIVPMFKIVKKYGDRIEFQHVRSHTGKTDWYTLGNDMADKLAKAGAMKGKQTIGLTL